MSEIERLHQARIAREASAKSANRGKPEPDPTEWAPKGWREDWEYVDHNVNAQALRTASGLKYASLANFQPGVVAGIEAQARGDLIREMDRQGIAVDERGVRMEWTLHAVGYGFRMPEGFIHPEAPDEVKMEGRKRWKRVVEIASDSLPKFLFVKVWRAKERALPTPNKVKILDGPEPREFNYTTSDDVVDGEVVED